LTRACEGKKKEVVIDQSALMDCLFKQAFILLAVCAVLAKAMPNEYPVYEEPEQPSYKPVYVAKVINTEHKILLFYFFIFLGSNK
jgi:hypothetical protein